MDTALVSAFTSATMARVELAVAARLLRMGADSGDAATKLVDAAQTNFDRLANVAAGIGTNLDISV